MSMTKKELSLFLNAFFAAVMLFLCGCSTAGLTAFRQEPPAEMKEIMPHSRIKDRLDDDTRQGIESLFRKDYNAASKSFNKALMYNPQNSFLHFLNGLSYHLLADAGDPKQYRYAEVGYQMSLKFNPNNYFAHQMMGILHFKNRQYRKAQESFAGALMYEPDNAVLLYGLASSSYYALDFETAVVAINRARKAMPNDPAIIRASAVITAASGDNENAGRYLNEYRKAEPDAEKTNALKQRVEAWQLSYKQKDSDSKEASPKDEESSPRQTIEDKRNEGSAKKDDKDDEDGGERMVAVDVVLIRTEIYDTTSKGVNLLEGLSMMFEGSSTFKRTIENTYDAPSTKKVERVLSSTVTFPAIKYNLNIFNAGDDRNEILARPTLVALDGKQSEFFSGSALYVAVSGKDYGSLEKVEVGTKLTVTPSFVSEDRVKLSVKADRDFIEPGVAGTFQQSLRISRNSVLSNITLKLG